MAQVKGHPTINRIKDPFAAMINAMSHQAISFAGGAARYNRLVALCNGDITPASLVAVSSKIRKAGFSKLMVRAMVSLADDVQLGNVDLSNLGNVSEEELYKRLSRPFFGPWSITFFRIYHLQHEHLLLFRDVSLQKAVQKLYKLKVRPSQATLEKMSQKWAPHESAACWFIYKAAGITPGPQAPPSQSAAKT